MVSRQKWLTVDCLYVNNSHHCGRRLEAMAKHDKALWDKKLRAGRAGSALNQCRIQGRTRLGGGGGGTHRECLDRSEVLCTFAVRAAGTSEKLSSSVLASLCCAQDHGLSALWARRKI